tara:strand:+ start:141 stop:350 length:210 start_codon:yes stop_codon:yes gene_type:complete
VVKVQLVVQQSLAVVEDQEVHQVIIDQPVVKDRVIHHQFHHHKETQQEEHLMQMLVAEVVQARQVQMEL